MHLAAVTDPQQTVFSGALLLALPIALLAGLVSFFSPCVLPLVPGYLSYVTGVTGTDLAEARRGRMAVGASLFVLGFTAVFVSGGALFGYAGKTLQDYKDVLSKVLGVLMILMGAFFMGLMPWLTQREFRFHTRPATGLVGAPLLGALFGIGWTPCIGPTLTAIFSVSWNLGDPWRAALLGLAYSLGLGIPFVLLALGFGWATRSVAFLRRHIRAVNLIGGALLVLLGLLMLTGVWTMLMAALQGVFLDVPLPL